MKNLKKTLATILVFAGVTCLLQTVEGAPPVRSAAFSTSGYGTLIGANYTEFVRLTLPAGKYLIVGKGLIQNQYDTSGLAACNMYGSGNIHLDTSDASLPAPSIIQGWSYATLAFNAVLDLPSAGDVWIECSSASGQPEMPGSFSLSAISVGSLTIQ